MLGAFTNPRGRRNAPHQRSLADRHSAARVRYDTLILACAAPVCIVGVVRAFRAIWRGR
jgi:hypothetical protein